jgi:hypothetical protein
MKLPERSIIEKMIAEYAHQSVQIEDNRLLLRDSIIISDYLSSTFLQEEDLNSLSADELCKTALPDLHSLLPDADPSQVAELRNHIIACYWVASKALQSLDIPRLDEGEVKCLSALIVKGTYSEALYSHGWGKRITPGEYRQTPIAARSNPLRIFPYHLEVPVLMQRFFEWRNDKKHLHPLIMACQTTVYFLYIHPFPDGNGRVSRLIMQDSMTRHGYVPVSMLGIERDEYLRMIREAQDGDPSDFVFATVSTQLDVMRTLRTREFLTKT